MCSTVPTPTSSSSAFLPETAAAALRPDRSAVFGYALGAADGQLARSAPGTRRPIGRRSGTSCRPTMGSYVSASLMFSSRQTAAATDAARHRGDGDDPREVSPTLITVTWIGVMPAVYATAARRRPSRRLTRREYAGAPFYVFRLQVVVQALTARSLGYAPSTVPSTPSPSTAARAGRSAGRSGVHRREVAVELGQHISTTLRIRRIGWSRGVKSSLLNVVDIAICQSDTPLTSNLPRSRPPEIVPNTRPNASTHLPPVLQHPASRRRGPGRPARATGPATGRRARRRAWP
jgi:hypothetical protein